MVCLHNSMKIVERKVMMTVIIRRLSHSQYRWEIVCWSVVIRRLQRCKSELIQRNNQLAHISHSQYRQELRWMSARVQYLCYEPTNTYKIGTIVQNSTRQHKASIWCSGTTQWLGVHLYFPTNTWIYMDIRAGVFIISIDHLCIV